MILGDNIFYGAGLSKHLREAESKKVGATIFGYYVNDPERFGIVEFDSNGKAISIEEKPENPKSNYCVTGLYFYDNRVVDFAKKVKPSERGELEITDLNKMYLEDGNLNVVTLGRGYAWFDMGELEITDLNKMYLEDGNLNVVTLGRGYAWFDMGTVDSLAEATEFIKVIETRQGIQIASLEEIAYLNKWIDKATLLESAKKYGKSNYGQYLLKVSENKIRY